MTPKMHLTSQLMREWESPNAPPNPWALNLQRLKLVLIDLIIGRWLAQVRRVLSVGRKLGKKCNDEQMVNGEPSANAN